MRHGRDDGNGRKMAFVGSRVDLLDLRLCERSHGSLPSVENQVYYIRLFSRAQQVPVRSEEPINSSLPSFTVLCRNLTVENFIGVEALNEESTVVVRIARCRDLHKKAREEPPPPSEEKSVEVEKQAAAAISKPYLGL
ncbi:hypothetical protein ACLOJK_015777 [Asimina triloba]